jgi:hypothetical protein
MFRLEAELAPSLATAMGHDAKKWTTFRHSCHNYLKGVILPEKFYDTVYQCIGNDGTQVYLKQLTEIFPESKVRTYEMDYILTYQYLYHK